MNALEDPAACAVRIRVPPEPTPGRRPSFPLLASAAPVVAAAAIWALTRSPFVLVFAALGPVVAVAGYLDGIRVRRRDDARARSVHERGRHELGARIAQVHEGEREAALSSTPNAARILIGLAASDARWRDDGASATVVLGSGTVPSRVNVDGPDEDPLVVSARRLEAAPLRVSLSSGIGVHGDPALVRSYVRGLLVQLGHTVAPNAARFDAHGEGAWHGVAEFPHRGGTPIHVIDGFAARSVGSVEDGAVIALAPTAAQLPARCRCIVHVVSPVRATIVGRQVRGVAEVALVELVSEAEQRWYARRLANHAPRDETDHLPRIVPLRSLLPRRGRFASSGLRTVIGIGVDGPVEIDLVAGGPHAIVGGTTGSGKSEFLTSWILALAAAHSPAQLTFLLADFKGGATFAALRRLPHCVGVITDLVPAEAERAFESLTAELRRREQRLAELGVKDIASGDAHGLARLVVIVDEAAYLLEQAPQLNRCFADIAARGRSLGVHLVLCTQRPAGGVRDAVAANCGLRICLRVHDVGDSRLLVGSDLAARLPHDAPGRLILSTNAELQIVQAARAEDGDIGFVVRAEDHEVPVHRPWLDPLPQLMRLPASSPRVDSLADALLGVVDRPAEQRQDVAAIDAGNLLVVGTRGTGKTSALSMIALQAAPGTIVASAARAEAVWDAVVESPVGAGALIIDDLDLALRLFSAEQQRAFLDALSTSLRSASGSGRVVVASAQRISDGLSALLPLFGRVATLRMSSRQEHQLVSPEAMFDAALPPGGGWWRGERIQLFAPPESTRFDELLPPLCRVLADDIPFGATPVAIVSSQPSVVKEVLSARGVQAVAPRREPSREHPEEGPFEIRLGGVDEWLVARIAFDHARAQGVVLLDGVGAADARALLGSRVVLPHCDAPALLMLRHDRFERCLPVKRWRR